jgi:hypothetical protein
VAKTTITPQTPLAYGESLAAQLGRTSASKDEEQRIERLAAKLVAEDLPVTAQSLEAIGLDARLAPRLALQVAIARHPGLEEQLTEAAKGQGLAAGFASMIQARRVTPEFEAFFARFASVDSPGLDDRAAMMLVDREIRAALGDHLAGRAEKARLDELSRYMVVGGRMGAMSVVATGAFHELAKKPINSLAVLADVVQRDRAAALLGDVDAAIARGELTAISGPPLWVRVKQPIFEVEASGQRQRLHQHQGTFYASVRTEDGTAWYRVTPAKV